MKRDFDLIRQLLLLIEAEEKSMAMLPAIDGYTEDQVGHHAYLLQQAGLITGCDPFHMGGVILTIPSSLTWAGHDFLDAMKDDTLWAKARETVIKPAAGVAFDVLLEWLKQEARTRLGF